MDHITVQAYQHRDSKRYIASMLKDGIETVSKPEYARSWDITNKDRKINFKRFQALHDTLLTSLGYEVVSVNITQYKRGE